MAKASDQQPEYKDPYLRPKIPEPQAVTDSWRSYWGVVGLVLQGASRWGRVYHPTLAEGLPPQASIPLVINGDLATRLGFDSWVMTIWVDGPKIRVISRPRTLLDQRFVCEFENLKAFEEAFPTSVEQAEDKLRHFFETRLESINTQPQRTRDQRCATPSRG